MAMKYRIEYDEFSRYQNKSGFSRLKTYIVGVALCVVLAVLLLYPPALGVLYDLILPGNPTVTISALQELSEALDDGASLSDAVDVFCHAVINGE